MEALKWGTYALGILHRNGGRYAEARQLYIKAEATCRGRSPACEVARSAALHNLAELDYVEGSPERAVLHFKEALAIRERQLGDSRETADTCSSMAAAYRDLGRYAEAKRLLHRAIPMLERYPQDGTVLSSALANLASIHAALGDLPQALALLDRSLEIQQAQPEMHGRHLVTTLNSIGVVHARLRQYQESEGRLREALSAASKLQVGADDTAALAWNNLALVLVAQRRYEEADACWRRSESIYEQILGSDHPRLARVLENHAHMLRGRRHKTEAQALEQRRREILSSHPEVRAFTVDIAELTR